MHDDEDRPVDRLVLANKAGPTIAFDGAPASGIIGGETWLVTLSAARFTGVDGNNQSAVEEAVAGYLRGSMTAMLRLRDTINSLEQLIQAKTEKALADWHASLN